MKNKKGVSVVVGYVILITFGIILSVIVYNYLKTYVPKDLLDCPGGVSLFIKDYECDLNTGQLNLTIKNNGRFNVEGYFIHGAEERSNKLATIDLSKNFSYNVPSGGSSPAGQSAVYFRTPVNNSLKPNEEMLSVFGGLTTGMEIIELIPARFQEENNIKRFVSCGNSKIREIITCS